MWNNVSMINISIKALNIQWMNFLNAQNPTENEHRKVRLVGFFDTIDGKG